MTIFTRLMYFPSIFIALVSLVDILMLYNFHILFSFVTFFQRSHFLIKHDSTYILNSCMNYISMTHSHKTNKCMNIQFEGSYDKSTTFYVYAAISSFLGSGWSTEQQKFITSWSSWLVSQSWNREFRASQSSGCLSCFIFWRSQFKSWPRDQLSWLMFFMVFLSPPVKFCNCILT
jgi:hypothetical protein